ncbi:MAG: SpoIIE family protein phosphatase [Erysipelotrichaceae bacterium]|nr:SpoIIE family protein phosphatase [Erysipelotrichaceae bacterium]
MNPILALLSISIIPICASLFFYFCFRNKDISNIKKQLIIGLIFGLISILGTEFGVPINGAVMNVRDAAPLCAGLIFGGPAGIIAGLIGGIERWYAVYWGAGYYTRLACSISTCLIGFIAAFVRKFVFDDRIPNWSHAMITTIVCEVIHMLMIFVTNLNEVKVAFNFVEICSVPMIFINTFAVAFSVYMVEEFGKEPGHEKNRKVPHLSNQVQQILIVVVVIGFIVTSFFSYLLQQRIAESETEDLLRLNILDVVEDLKHQTDDYLLRINRHVVDEINKHPDISLDELEQRYNISEINIINDKGVIVRSTEYANKNYDMSWGSQSREFLCLLEGEKEYVQAYGPISRDGSVYRKYSGIATEDGFIQIGLGEEEFTADIASRLSSIVHYRHIGETGNMLVIDSKGKVISTSIAGYDADNQNDDIRLDPNGTKEYTVYKAVINGGEYYYMYTRSEGFKIYAVLPADEADFSKKISTYLNQFMQSILSGALFVTIYMIIKSMIVDNIRKVNSLLSDITEGDLDTVVDVRSNREFVSLSDGINTTVDSLKHFIAEANSRIDNELRYARDIQTSALPSGYYYEDRKEFDIYAIMDPAKEVGGDFYDFYMLGKHRLVFLVADVAGKGIPASLFMMRAKAILKTYAENNISIADIFTNANYQLCEGNDAGMFVTVWMGMLNLETGELKYANAGHNKPLLRRKDGTFEYLQGPAGFVMAGMEGVTYKEQTLMMQPGDEIFLYTDGVVEATDTDKQLYGDERLRDCANRCIGMDSRQICDTIKAHVEHFYEGAEQFDDITELSVQFKEYYVRDKKQ